MYVCISIYIYIYIYIHTYILHSIPIILYVLDELVDWFMNRAQREHKGSFRGYPPNN